MTDDAQQHSTRIAARDADVTAHDLWLHYFSIGGNLRVPELDAYLNGVCLLPVGERNIVAQALNETIDDLPQRPRAFLDDDLAPRLL